MNRCLENTFGKCEHYTCNKGPLVTDAESDEVVCTSCGMVMEEKTEERRYENSIFLKENNASDSRSGPGIKLSFYDMGLSTVIHSQNTDSTGKLLPFEIRNEFCRLRKWDRYSKNKKNQKFNEPFILLDAIRSKLNLSESVVEKSAYMYRKAAYRNLIRGRSKSVAISAAIYAACRSTNTPRTLKDIAEAANVKRKNLQKTYRILAKGLEMALNAYDPVDFVTRLSSSVGVKERTRLDAISYLVKARDMELTSGKNPIGIASAALYLACVHNNEKTTQSQIAEAAGVTSVTVRTRYKTLAKEMKEKTFADVA